MVFPSLDPRRVGANRAVAVEGGGARLSGPITGFPLTPAPRSSFLRSGTFAERDAPRSRDYRERAFTIGIGGPVGSGKTALLLQLCRRLRDEYSLAVVTNDIFTKEDGEFLVRHEALPPDRIIPVETGGCPHTAVRDDVSQNLDALGQLMICFQPDLLFVESGGDNLAAQFSRDLADFRSYVIDVSGGDKIPRKGGPGITQSDLLVINKTDLAPLVGASLDVMARDARMVRGDGPSSSRKSCTASGFQTSPMPLSRRGGARGPPTSPRRDEVDGSA